MNARETTAFCRSAYRKGLKPDPPLTVSQWADKYRMLPRESSAEPGLWRTDRTPYLREIMDNLSPSSPVEKIVFMKGSQIGATEAGINWMGYIVHQAPGPMLIVQPTVDIAKTKLSKLRLNPTINATPVLRERMRESGSRTKGATDTLLTKEFPGGILLLGGANSAAALRSMPIRYLFLDEIDAYPSDLEGEGDPVALAEKRTDTFPRRKIFQVSTPTVKGASRIEAAFEESDQRRFHVPCPYCDQLQWLKWAQIRFEHKDYQLVDEVTYECEHCQELIAEQNKPRMFKRGRWIPECPDAARPIGYHLSALYSPIGWLSWRKIAQSFLDTKKTRDATRLKTWVNTIMGETWQEKGSSIEASELYSHRSKYGPKVPMAAAILTAGVDVQKDRLECEVIGWGLHEESWGMEFKVFIGNPGAQQVWQQLDEYLAGQWEHESGVLLPVACTCIDTGGHFTQQTYAFIMRRQSRRIYAIKGSSQPARPIVGRPSMVYNKKVRLFGIGTDTAKDSIYARLQLTEPGPGYPHFPLRDERGYDDEHFKQLTAERVVWRKGKRVWEKRYAGIRNEALDIRVYATGALEILKTFAGLKLDVALKRLENKIEIMKQQENGEPEPEEVVVRRPHRRGFVTKW